MLNIEKIKEHLNRLGAKAPELFLFDLTDSTNTRAKEYAKSKQRNTPSVFLAEEQSQGRGRRGRSFITQRGGGIFISFLIFPDCQCADTVKLTANAAVKLSRAIRTVTGAIPAIKWVNDIYLKDKKLAGILCEAESAPDGKTAYFVCGMGINVYKSAIAPEISDIAISIEDATGLKIDRNILTAAIIAEFMKEEQDCDLLAEYKLLSFITGRDITVLPATEDSYNAKALEILDDYSLLIKPDIGPVSRIFTGEVSVKLNKREL